MWRDSWAFTFPTPIAFSEKKPFFPVNLYTPKEGLVILTCLAKGLEKQYCRRQLYRFLIQHNQTQFPFCFTAQTSAALTLHYPRASCLGPSGCEDPFLKLLSCVSEVWKRPSFRARHLHRLLIDVPLRAPNAAAPRRSRPCRPRGSREQLKGGVSQVPGPPRTRGQRPCGLPARAPGAEDLLLQALSVLSVVF